ncbi:MAG: hypothetical protein K2P68_03125 [Sphingomonas sp.]|nr:hypothetical protein [Sphingomonas sp.]
MKKNMSEKIGKRWVMPTELSDASHWNVRLGRVLHWFCILVAFSCIGFGIYQAGKNYFQMRSSIAAVDIWDKHHKADLIYTVDAGNGLKLDIQAPPHASRDQLQKAIDRYRSAIAYDEPKEGKKVTPMIVAGEERPIVEPANISILLIAASFAAAFLALGRTLRYLLGNE